MVAAGRKASSLAEAGRAEMVAGGFADIRRSRLRLLKPRLDNLESGI